MIFHVDTNDVDTEELNESRFMDSNEFAAGSYEFFYNQYDDQQKLLEPNHNYKWLPGEHECEHMDEHEQLFLTEEQKNKISDMEPVEIFQFFFSKDLKKYIIEATLENGYVLKPEKLDKFIGILVGSIVNVKKRERDYWSQSKLLHHDMIADALSRDEFLDIKRFLKLSKRAHKDLNNKIWRVHHFVELFKINICQFGFFSSRYSIDESMIKFFGRSNIKQYMKNKPIRFGIKFWAICSISGYLFDFDIYRGKVDSVRPSAEKLKNCTLGARVVMKMLHKLLLTVPKQDLEKYHVCFDNFFTSPDVLLHLKNLGLKATGTVRQNRVYEKKMEQNKEKRVTVPVSIDKKSIRGSSECKYDEHSNINYISVKDSKVVSILSTAAGITPTTDMERYSTADKKRIPISFPRSFKIYNKNMCGVDLQDQHCNDVKIEIKSKKWTWAILLRTIEIAISNATVLYNLCTKKEKKSTYDFVIDIANFYLQKSKDEMMNHKIVSLQDISRKCITCAKKVITYCFHFHICAKNVLMIYMDRIITLRGKQQKENVQMMIVRYLLRSITQVVLII